MPYANTTHGKIHYTVKGDGDPVVLIHGLGCWSEHWFGWDVELAKYFKIITFDARGLGNSSAKMMMWHSLVDLASDLAAILRAEGLDSAHIIGTSLGGMVALLFGIHYPNLTRSLSIIASSIGGSGHSRISIPAAKLLLKSPVKGPALYDSLAKLLTSPHTDKMIVQRLAEHWRSIDQKTKQNPFTVIAQLIAVSRFRNWRELAKIKCPTQIVVGRDDQFVPRGNSLYLHSKMPNSKLINVENAGHEPHIDQPELMTKIVTTFIGSVESPNNIVTTNL